MRKIFGGSLVFSLVGVALLGGVFAWSFSGTQTGSNQVGTGGIEVGYTPNGNLLGPDGHTTFAGVGGVGTLNDFELLVDMESSKVKIDSVPGDDATCTVSMFQGEVKTLSPGVPVTGAVSGEWEYYVNILTHDADTAAGNPLAVPASKACQGRTVNYTVTIVADTTGNFSSNAPTQQTLENGFD